MLETSHFAVFCCFRDVKRAKKDEDNGIHETTLAALIKINKNYLWMASRVLEAPRCTRDECKSSDEIAAYESARFHVIRLYLWADGRLNSESFCWAFVGGCRWIFCWNSNGNPRWISSSFDMIPFKVDRLRFWIVFKKKFSKALKLLLPKIYYKTTSFEETAKRRHVSIFRAYILNDIR